MVDVRLGHLAQKVTRITRQTLDVTSLPLRINRVKCQRTLARPADAGEANQLVARQHHIHVAQIVLPRTANYDIRDRHIGTTSLPREWCVEKPIILAQPRAIVHPQNTRANPNRTAANRSRRESRSLCP